MLKGLSRIVYLAILSQLLAEHFYVNSNYEANKILSVMFMQQTVSSITPLASPSNKLVFAGSLAIGRENLPRDQVTTTQ